jgi:PDZ domain-containing protein
MKRLKLMQARRYLLSIFIGAAAAYLLFFLPLPYFIMMPGTAEVVRPMVHLKQGETSEKGSFMLTTVSVIDTNVANYLVALINPYEELTRKTSLFRKGETEQEYTQRQQYVMLTSQSDAMQAAYRKAGVPYHIQNEGVMVLQTLPGLPAEKVLQAGDYLLKVDNNDIHTSADLLNYIKTKKAGDTVNITYKRDKNTFTASLKLGMLPLEQAGSAAQEPPRPGLGIVPGDVQSVKADKEEEQITVNADNIGGPSAGLMFSLEMYSQLTREDITKGYHIAGTGTIDPKGNVGVIGGIKHKIVAADKAGAEIFFAPKDLYPKPGENFQPVLNYSDAVARARQIHSKMNIVPVETLDDALKYLAGLPPKGQ